MPNKNYTTGLIALGGVAALYFLSKQSSAAGSNPGGGYWYRYTTPGTPGYTLPNRMQNYGTYEPSNTNYRGVGYSPQQPSGGSMPTIPTQLPLTAPSTPVKINSPLPDHSPAPGGGDYTPPPLDYVYVTPQAYVSLTYTLPDQPQQTPTVSTQEGYQITGYQVEVTPEDSYFNPPSYSPSTPNVSATEGYQIPGYSVPVTPINPYFNPDPLAYVQVTPQYTPPNDNPPVPDYVQVTPQSYTPPSPAAYTPPSPGDNDYTPPSNYVPPIQYVQVTPPVATQSYTPPSVSTYSPPSPGYVPPAIQYVPVTPRAQYFPPPAPVAAPYHVPNLEYNYSDWTQRNNAWRDYLMNIKYVPPPPVQYHAPNLEYNYSDFTQRLNAWIAYLNNQLYTPQGGNDNPSVSATEGYAIPNYSVDVTPSNYAGYFNNDYGGNYVKVTPGNYGWVDYNNAYSWWYSNM